MATIRYSSSPTDHRPTETGASRPDCDGQAGTRTAATSDSDWVATIHSSQLPLTPPSTESRVRSSMRLAGTP